MKLIKSYLYLFILGVLTASFSIACSRLHAEELRFEDFDRFSEFNINDMLDKPGNGQTSPGITLPSQPGNSSELGFTSFDNYSPNDDSPGNREGTVPLPTPRPPIVQPKPATGTAFSLSKTTFDGAGRRNRRGYQWNGCSKTALVTGSIYSNNPKNCSNNGMTQFNTDLGDHLQKHFMPCARKAAKDAGLPIPSKVFLKLGSVRADRGKNGCGSCSGWSQHAYGRALDIFNFNLYNSRGQRTQNISADQGNYAGHNRIYYNSFVMCWEKTVRNRCGKSSGTIIHRRADRYLNRHHNHNFYSNDAHATHIHLAFPNGCGGKL